MVTLSTQLIRARWLACLTLVAVAGLLFVGSSGCVPPPPPDDQQPSSSGNDDSDSSDDGDGTTDAGGGSGADGGTDSGGGGSTSDDDDGGAGGGGTGDGSDGGGTTDDGAGDATDGGGSDGGDAGGDGIDDVADGGDTGGDGGGDAGGGDGGGDAGGGDDGGTVPDPGPPTSVALELVVQTGDAVPEQPADTTFTYFSDPVIDVEGRVAFWGLYEGASARGGAGLYVWDGSELQRVLDDDPSATGVVPGRETADFFGKNGPGYDPRERDLIWGAGDRLLFTSEVGGEAPTRGAYRWRATDGNVVRIADREQVVQVYREELRDLMDPKFFLPGVSDNGLAGFSIGYIGIDPSTSSFFTGQGVFTSNGTSVSALRDTELSGDAPGDVPDQGDAAFYVEITEQTTISPAGDLLFEGRYAGGDGLLGLYLARAGNVYRVVDNRPSASWPGLPAGAWLNSGGTAYVFAVGPAGHIAVETTLTVDSDADNVVIVWDWDAGNWASLTGPGGVEATALVTGVNDDGQVVLLAGGDPYRANRAGRTQLNAVVPAELQGAALTWLGESGSINNHGRAVLHFQDGDANPGLVMWTGAELLVVANTALDYPAGGIVEISTVTDPRRDRPGRSGMLNDSDECVFRTVFTDNSEALYVGRGQ